jgi:hypothetical protein
MCRILLGVGVILPSLVDHFSTVYGNSCLPSSQTSNEVHSRAISILPHLKKRSLMHHLEGVHSYFGDDVILLPLLSLLFFLRNISHVLYFPFLLKAEQLEVKTVAHCSDLLSLVNQPPKI